MENLLEYCLIKRSKGSMFYPNLGSILNAGEYHNKNAHWDIESQTDGEDHESEAAGAYCDESLRSPLISCQTRSMGKPRSGGSALGVRCNTILMKGNVEASEAISSSMDTGGGWQLAYKYSDRVGEDGKKEFKKCICIRIVHFGVSLRRLFQFLV
ncbi:unnamed protein product [Malus baccata var. baccata]